MGGTRLKVTKLSETDGINSSERRREDTVLRGLGLFLPKEGHLSAQHSNILNQRTESTLRLVTPHSPKEWRALCASLPHFSQRMESTLRRITPCLSQREERTLRRVAHILPKRRGELCAEWPTFSQREGRTLRRVYPDGHERCTPRVYRTVMRGVHQGIPGEVYIAVYTRRGT